jgi:hypothetical protein
MLGTGMAMQSQHLLLQIWMVSRKQSTFLVLNLYSLSCHLLALHGRHLPHAAAIVHLGRNVNSRFGEHPPFHRFPALMYGNLTAFQFLGPTLREFQCPF